MLGLPLLLGERRGGRELEISHEGLMGYWDLKGCERSFSYSIALCHSRKGRVCIHAASRRARSANTYPETRDQDHDLIFVLPHQVDRAIRAHCIVFQSHAI